jgi:DNA end-binding protein Ku
MWKGSISFGLVNIPISLTPAVSPKDVHFHLFHDADGGRIRERRVCEVDGKEVAYEHVVKGYERSKGEVVTLTRDELKAMDPVADRTIAIETFVKLDELDPLLFDRSYFVMPEGRSDKAYALLASAMEASQMVGIGRVVLSSRQHLCMIRLSNGALQLITLVYADELVAAPARVKSTASKKEVEMATALVKQLAGPFAPGKFTDEYRERVLEAIEQKARGQALTPGAEPKAQKVTSLTEALERSLSQARNDDKPRASPARAHPRAARRRKSA